MHSIAVLAALPLFAAQERPSQEEIRVLIERLSSNDIAAREGAEQWLAAIGETARPALERVVRKSDRELRSCAAFLLCSSKSGLERACEDDKLHYMASREHWKPSVGGSRGESRLRAFRLPHQSHVSK